MITKKQEQKERRRGSKLFGKFLAFFAPFFLNSVPAEALNLSKEYKTGRPGRWEGYTFRRIKKVGNYYVYGWVLNKR